MREKDLSRLEHELEIKLPIFYRTFMANYTFPKTSWAGDLGSPDDVELLLELNQEERDLPNGTDPDDLFFVGSDGQGLDYFFTLADPQGAVAAYDTVTKEVSIVAKTFDEWQSQLKDANAVHDSAVQQDKKWWQVWK